jgi:hypothetical protein
MLYLEMARQNQTFLLFWDSSEVQAAERNWNLCVNNVFNKAFAAKSSYDKQLFCDYQLPRIKMYYHVAPIVFKKLKALETKDQVSAEMEAFCK